MNKTEIIRKLNDAFRTTFTGGRILTTIGIRHKPVEDVSKILSKVQHFRDFNSGNDPYGEHDFGKFAYGDDVIIWKIDYYDKKLQYHSPDASDSSKTTRIMTIMTAEEW